MHVDTTISLNQTHLATILSKKDVVNLEKTKQKKPYFVYPVRQRNIDELIQYDSLKNLEIPSQQC